MTSKLRNIRRWEGGYTFEPLSPQEQQWRPPDRRRLRRIRDVLREYYGRPRNDAHRAPLDELILTILSQNTNDRNRDVAYTQLRSRFERWEDIAAAPLGKVEEAIRPGGISKVKSARIQQILHSIESETGSLDLDWLENAPRERALEFLESLPGVGRKTAACVLLFSYDRPELPVDTHVYRVASRLGLIRPGASFEEAHETLRALSDPDDVYELHVNLLRHGRRLCRPTRPLCEQCPLLRLCPYGRARRESKPGAEADPGPRPKPARRRSGGR
jgi:endonuclease III